MGRYREWRAFGIYNGFNAGGTGYDCEEWGMRIVGLPGELVVQGGSEEVPRRVARNWRRRFSNGTGIFAR